jgi:HEPN domain-containing protein
MNELTREWVDKAEGDYRTASREQRVKRGANFDAVCFHSQQCAASNLDEHTT